MKSGGRGVDIYEGWWDEEWWARGRYIWLGEGVERIMVARVGTYTHLLPSLHAMITYRF